DVVIAPFPTAFWFRIARRGGTVIIAVGNAGWSEGTVGCPGLGTCGQRQFAALSNPDAVGRLCKYGAHRSPGPALVLDAVRAILQGLRPILHEFVRPALLLPTFIQCGTRCCGGSRGRVIRRPAATHKDRKRCQHYHKQNREQRTWNTHLESPF